MVFRVTGLCAALATALLIAAVAGAQDPLAQEGKDLQDQATGTGQSLLPQIVFSSTRDNLAPSFEGSGCDLIGSSTMPTFNYLRCQNQNQRELYLMNLDGTDPVRLTTNTYGETTAALSPNGKNIVFDSNRLRDVTQKVQSLNTSDLYMMSTDFTDVLEPEPEGEPPSTSETHLGRGSSATWSPDSKNIAYHASASGDKKPIFSPDPGVATTDSDIFALNMERGTSPREEPTNLTKNGAETIDDDADWSPDGKTIIFTSFPGPAPATLTGPNIDVPNREIYAMNADGTDDPSEWTKLTQNAVEERGAAWSPDGNHILFSCRIGIPPPPTDAIPNPAKTLEVCLRDVNYDDPNDPDKPTGTSNEVRLTTNALPEGSASWTPDGKQIVFQRTLPAPPAGNIQIFVMDPKDEEKISDDGTTIVAGKDGEGDNLKPLTTSPDQGTQFSPRAGVIRVSDVGSAK